MPPRQLSQTGATPGKPAIAAAPGAVAKPSTPKTSTAAPPKQQQAPQSKKSTAGDAGKTATRKTSQAVKTPTGGKKKG